jgi:hypothetical protein
MIRVLIIIGAPWLVTENKREDIDSKERVAVVDSLIERLFAQ